MIVRSSCSFSVFLGGERERKAAVQANLTAFFLLVGPIAGAFCQVGRVAATFGGRLCCLGFQASAVLVGVEVALFVVWVFLRRLSCLFACAKVVVGGVLASWLLRCSIIKVGRDCSAQACGSVLISWFRRSLAHRGVLPLAKGCYMRRACSSRPSVFKRI